MDRGTRTFLIVGALVTLVVAVGLSQLASTDPDGLEFVADQEGFAATAQEHDLADTPLADYGDGLTGNSNVDRAIAGVVGVLATLGVAWVVLRMARRTDGTTGA